MSEQFPSLPLSSDPLSKSPMLQIKKINLTENTQFKVNEVMKKDSAHIAREFFSSISGGVPRPELIKDLVKLTFPDGINSISLRKIMRYSNEDLLYLIGENIAQIQSKLTSEIYQRWLEECHEKLTKAARIKKTDYSVLLFINCISDEENQTKKKEIERMFNKK
jgi:hypothetical protein